MSQTKAIVETVNIPVDRIKPSPYQPRLAFNLEDIRGSIQRDGILIPLTVREKDGYYELIDGERRLRLAKELGYKTVSVTVIDVDDKTARRMVWKVNTLRQDYSPKEKAYYFKKLQEPPYGMSLRGIARECDYSEDSVVAHLNVLKLPEKYQKLVWDGPLSVSHIRELRSLFNEGAPTVAPAIKWLDQVIDRKLTHSELRESIRPELREIEERRIKAAQEVIKEVTPVPEAVKLETPEELEQAAKVLKREAKRRKTPQQKHQELVDKAWKALSSFPSLEKAKKLGVDIGSYKEKLEKIESYLKEKPKEAWNDFNSLKKEFNARIKEAEAHRREEEEKRREEEIQRRIEEEARKRARELEAAEKRLIEDEAKKKAQEEILSNPELLQEVAERAREERYQEFGEMEERAREAAGEIAGPLRDALLKAQQDILEVKNSEKRKLLENYMMIGSVLTTLEKRLIFDIEHENEEQMLVWKSGIPLTETHRKLKKKLDMD